MGNNMIEQTLKRLAWIGGLFIIAGLIISAVEYKKTSSLKGIEIKVVPLAEGNSLITEEDLHLLLSKSFPGDLHEQTLENLDLDRLERVLEADPFVKEADAYLDAKNQLHLSVEQREPLVRVIDRQGISYYLDESGFRMPLSTHFTARVPVATGNINPYDPGFLQNEQDGVFQVFRLAQKLKADPFFKALIEQIYMDTEKTIFLVPKVGRQKIRFGKWADVEKRLQRIKVYYNEILPYAGWNKYKTIDVQYEGQVVCQK